MQEVKKNQANDDFKYAGLMETETTAKQDL